MMRDIFKIALVMVAVAIVIVPMFDEPSSGGDSFSASIEGYVKVNGVLAYNDSIEITIHYPLTAPASEYTKKSVIGLDDSGHFRIDGIPRDTYASSCLISFTLNGYSISNLPSQIQSTSEVIGGQVCYRLSSTIGKLDGNTTYTLGDNDLYSISMFRSYGSVNGRIVTDTTTPVGLNSASVSIETKGGATVATARTSDGGYFNIDKCSTGSYVIIVKMNGYKTYSSDIVIEQTKSTDLGEIRMSSDNGLFGMDFNHVLMSLAAIITIAIVLFTTVYMIHSKRK